MIRELFFTALFLPATLVAEELSDTDVEGIVFLANGLIKGEIISLIEMEKCSVTDECSTYRNAEVTIRTYDGDYRSFRASKIGDVWKVDEAEWKRLQYVRRLYQKIRNPKVESAEDAA